MVTVFFIKFNFNGIQWFTYKEINFYNILIKFFEDLYHHWQQSKKRKNMASLCRTDFILKVNDNQIISIISYTTTNIIIIYIISLYVTIIIYELLWNY